MTKRYPIVYINGFPAENLATDRLYGSGNVEVGEVAPALPQDGDLWYETPTDGSDEILKVYLDSAASWKKVSSELFNTTIEPTAGVQEGDFWYHPVTASLTMYIGTSWVSMGGGGSGGGGGGSISDILAFSY